VGGGDGDVADFAARGEVMAGGPRVVHVIADRRRGGGGRVVREGDFLAIRL